MKPELLVIGQVLPEGYHATLEESFTVHYVPTGEDYVRAVAPDVLSRVRAVLTTGTFGLTADQMDTLPGLEIVACKGAGYDGVDLDAAKQRNVLVTHSPGANASSVSEQALALILATVREVPQSDAAVRRGDWMKFRHYRPLITKKRLGILGLGHIGLMVAKRASAGFDMSVGYHSRSPRDDVAYTYHKTLVSLAEASDVLVITCPGGESTRGIVNAEVLTALGPDGYVVNMARGSVVVTDDLVAALKKGEIAGAGLDVVEGEPEVPPALVDLPNVVMTPHLGARSPEGANAALDMAADNIKAYLAGDPLISPVPGFARDADNRGSEKFAASAD